MITKTVGFKVGDKFFTTIEDAQRDALIEIFKEADCNGGSGWTHSEIADTIVGHLDEVIDILTTTEKSRPSARAVNGGKKPRKPRHTVVTPDGNIAVVK